ncbi:MAG: hypothetical protein AAF648_10295 [Pseudomonadota bacterium]
MDFDCLHCRFARREPITAPGATLGDLLKEAPPGLRTLAPGPVYDWLCQVKLHDCVITTTNGHALSSARGNTARWTRIHLDAHPATQRLTLSPAGPSGGHAVFTPRYEALRGLDALHFYGSDDRLSHRIIFGSHGTGALLGRLRETPVAIAEQAPPADASTRVDQTLGHVLEARRTWDHMGPAGHLEHVQLNQGTDRLSALPHMGYDRARRIEHTCLPHWLNQLLTHGMVYTRVVIGDGWSQADGSEVSKLSTDAGHLLVHSTLGIVSLDFGNLGSCWETHFNHRGSRFSFLELYSGCGQCMAVLAPYRDYLQDHWGSLTGGLPDR